MTDERSSTPREFHTLDAADSKAAREVIERRIKSYERQLRRLASELSLAEARERREIASDLHDHIGQALAYVSQRVSLMRGNSIFSGMENDFSEVLSILDQTIRYTRDLTVEISPPILYELGLPAALAWLAERNESRYRFKVHFKQRGAPAQMTEDVRVFMFKAVQELINNAAKHAEASQVEVTATWGERTFEVVVRDNGTGFDTKTFNDGFYDDCCFGLFSIRERLSYIGGEIKISSTPGHGTEVAISAPYDSSSEYSDG